MDVVGRPSLWSRTTPTKRQRAPSLERASASRAARSMGESVRYTSTAGDRRQESHLVSLAQDGVGRDVLAIDGGRRRRGETPEEGDFATERVPELTDARARGD